MSKSRGAGFYDTWADKSEAVAESESRFDSKLSTLSEEKDAVSMDCWV